MRAIKKVLCPTDFSEAAGQGVAAGADLAARYQAEVYLVHVVPVVPSLPPDPNYLLAVPEYERALHVEAERQLEKQAAELEATGLVVHTRIGHGSAGTEIVRLAAEEDVDLIVIATHGATGWQHAMFGSVAEKVVRLAQRPVLTVPAARP